MPDKKTPIEETLARVHKHCSGPEHNDYYVVNDALTLAVSLLSPVNHSRFRRQWREFQSLQRRNSGPGCTIESFLAKKRGSHATPRTSHPSG
jgi:hypothetical protein